uniref:Uncharacterized protein n=1 Tax=Arundo donax TaxID=35708 RepID=A0A0A8YN41_ARUDO
MDAYCQEVRKLESKFDGLELTHVLCGDNEVADELAKMGSTRALVPVAIFIQKLHIPSVYQPEEEKVSNKQSNDKQSEIEVLVVILDWIGPYINYIMKDEFLVE